MQGIIDNLIKEHTQDTNKYDNSDVYKRIKLNESDLCRALLDSKYKSVYLQRFSNIQVDIDKKYVQLNLCLNLIITNDITLFVDSLEFWFDIDKNGIPSVFIEDAYTHFVIAYIDFKLID